MDDESYDDEEDEESDQDLGSELGDTLDVNDVNRDIDARKRSDGNGGSDGSEESDPSKRASQDVGGVALQIANSNAKTPPEPSNSGSIAPARQDMGNSPDQKFNGRRRPEDPSPAIIDTRQRSLAHASNSDVTSQHRSHRSRKVRLRRDGDATSRLDSVSNASGFMSRSMKKRSVRRGEKRSISLAVQNETLIHKIQE